MENPDGECSPVVSKDAASEDITSERLALTDAILRELECPVCKDVLFPPIYMCATGHSLCKFCFPRVTYCPVCRGSLQSARNFTLENVANKLEYPCKFKETGCTFRATLEIMFKHERKMHTPVFPCILKCEWTGTSGDMRHHLRQKHPDSIVAVGQHCKQDLNKDAERYQAIIFGDDILRLKISNSIINRSFKIEIEQLWAPESRNIRYRISILDKNFTNLEYKHIRIGENGDSSITVIRDSLEPYCLNGFVYYFVTLEHRS